MHIIVGLGNPGREYARTRHNVGFDVIDVLSEKLDIPVNRSAMHGLTGSGFVGGEKVLLVKPQTYMNLSGDCVAPVLRYHNATINDLVVVSDDIDLPVGKMRIRKGGGPGGHNGLKSVIERAGSPDFARLRVGVGRDAHNRANVIGHVLGKFSPDDRKVMDEVVAEAVNAVETMTTQNLETAMNRYNGWTAPAAAAPAGEGNK